MGPLSASVSRLLTRRSRCPTPANGLSPMRAIRLLCFVSVTVSVAGCAVGPDYHQPQMKLPEQFTAAPPPDSAAGRETIDPGNWWHALGDSQLDSLIDRAIRASTSLEIALTRLQEARTYETILTGQALPFV